MQQLENYTNNNTARRYKAHVSIFGTTQFHLRNPYVIAWWSVAFPGFGHLLLSKYLRGFVLLFWEFFVNINAKVNLAMIYSFQGNIQQAIQVLDTRWLLIYIPVYIFTIWDSYRTTVDMNKVYVLAEREDHKFNSFSIGALEINYLDKRSPIMAAFWSLAMPGLGQLYIHRIVTAFVIIAFSVATFYFSHALEAVSLLFLGEVEKATSVLKPQWLLMFPSIYGFVIYDAYVNTVENNKLYEKEQRKFLKNNYQSKSFQILKGSLKGSKEQ